MDAAFEQRVRERAYEIWMAAGMEDGAADLHWQTAEQFVMNEAGQPTVKLAGKAAAKKPAVKKATAPARKTAKVSAANA